jgi:xanthosine utilization system XapX-like protein
MDGGSLTMYLSFLPSILLCVVGIILAIVFWSRCPAACAMTLIGLILILLLNLAQPILQRLLFEGGPERDLISAFFMLMGLLRTGGFGLVLAAVFMGRRAPAYGMAQPYGRPTPNMPTPMPPIPVPPLTPASQSAPSPGGYGITTRTTDTNPRA